MFTPIDKPTITLPCQIRGEPKERNKNIVSARRLRFLPWNLLHDKKTSPIKSEPYACLKKKITLKIYKSYQP